MKHLTFILLLFVTQISNGQWNEQNSGVTTQLTDILFSSNSEGYAVGNSKILKTTDGGSNWSTSYDCTYLLEAIEFTQNKIHVVGYNIATSESMVLSSIDNGTTWTELVLPQAGFLYDVFFPTDLIGYSIGSQGNLLKTIDGGSSWNLHGTGISSMIQEIYFHDTNHGFAVGGFSGGYMYETLDGGLTWSEITIAASTFLQGITFSSPNIGYAVGWDGDIFKTTDGGVNWTQQTPVQVYGNMDVHFTNDNTGYIVGGDAAVAEIQKTTDGGNSWFSQSPVVNQGLIGLHFPSANTGFAVGAGGTILNTSNAGGLTISEIESNLTRITLFPNPCVNSFEFSLSSNISAIDQIEIISDNGQIVYSQPYAEGKEINVTELLSGVYLVRIKLQEESIIKKLYKK